MSAENTGRSVCLLSAGDLEMIADGEAVGPWLFGDSKVYVRLDESEVDKVSSVNTQAREEVEQE